jgi:hypothetical protein
MRQVFIISVLLLFCTNCIATNKNKKNISTIDQLELQEEIQRFYTRFTERIVDASYKEKALIENYQEETLRAYLLYDSEALKIATAPFPVANLLDMIVFIKLNKIVIQDYWIPNVYGKPGQALFRAFDESDKDLERITSKVMKPDKLFQLDQLIQNWREENPEQVRVEKVRLADFSKFIKSKDKKESSFSIVDIESAVQATDQVILVANRGIFLAQQLPLIVRLHARLGTQEILSDTINSLQSAPALIDNINETHTLVSNLKELVSQMDNLAKSTYSILEILPTNLKDGIDVNKALAQLDSLVLKTTYLVGELKPGQSINTEMVKEIRNEFHEFILFLAFVTILVGTCISVVWWTSFYFCKKLLKS